ncbi:hypothetical protein V6N13_147534 [Hibiscus sabdariffa]
MRRGGQKVGEGIGPKEWDSSWESSSVSNRSKTLLSNSRGNRFVTDEGINAMCMGISSNAGATMDGRDVVGLVGELELTVCQVSLVCKVAGDCFDAAYVAS